MGSWERGERRVGKVCVGLGRGLEGEVGCEEVRRKESSTCVPFDLYCESPYHSSSRRCLSITEPIPILAFEDFSVVDPSMLSFPCEFPKGRAPFDFPRLSVPY